jgi:hypothetical protein
VHDGRVGEDPLDDGTPVGGFHGHDAGQYCLVPSGGSRRTCRETGWQ